MKNKNNYVKASCEVIPYNQDFADVLTMQLGEMGFESFVDTAQGVDAYILDENFTEALQRNLETSNFEFFKVHFSFEEIVSQNWNEEWEKHYFEPLHVGNECVIRAPFHPAFPNRKYEIVIEPKMAFGTGNHETTYLMMEEILKLDFSGKKVLDMGCGTGVLAILASMLGAKGVTAIDYDIWSYESALENAEKNNIHNIVVEHGDASLLGKEKYDIVLANIHRNVLLSDIKHYRASMHSSALLLLSGFYSKDLEDIRNEAQAQGLTYVLHRERKDWNMAEFKLNSSS